VDLYQKTQEVIKIPLAILAEKKEKPTEVKSKHK